MARALSSLRGSESRLASSAWPIGLRIVAIASAIAVLALLVAFVLFSGKQQFNSDDAVLSLQAESMWHQKALFPRGWIYNNGDLLTPSGTFVIAPLLAWFANTYELHAVASLFAIVLMIASIFCFLTSCDVNRTLVWVGIAVAASGLSPISAYVTYLQTTYVWWPAGFFLGASAIWRYRTLKSDSARRKLGLRIGWRC